MITQYFGRVAQLVRAQHSHCWGHWFEPSRDYHLSGRERPLFVFGLERIKNAACPASQFLAAKFCLAFPRREIFVGDCR